MLKPHLKVTDASLDLSSQLCPTLHQKLGSRVSEASSLRKLVAALPSDLSGSDFHAARELLLSYSASLEAIRTVADRPYALLRPPNSDCLDAGPLWFDSYRLGQKSIGGGLEFDLACSVYNLAALECHAAIVEDRDSPSGAQKASKAFGKAASLFALVRDHLLPPSIQSNVTTDMSHECLSLWTSLAETQGNVCFYEKALQEKLSRGLIARLAWHVAEDYEKSASLAASLEVAIGKGYAESLYAREKIFRAAAFWHQAFVERADCSERGVREFGRRFDSDWQKY